MKFHHIVFVLHLPWIYMFTSIFLGNWYEIFSQSLERRPRSIYDVLDHSAANREPDQSKAKPKKKEPQKTVSVNLRCFVTFSVENNKACIWWPVLYFLHRWLKPQSMKTYWSPSMRIFESQINLSPQISVAEVISVCLAVSLSHVASGRKKVFRQNVKI